MYKNRKYTYHIYKSIQYISHHVPLELLQLILHRMLLEGSPLLKKLYTIHITSISQYIGNEDACLGQSGHFTAHMAAQAKMQRSSVRPFPSLLTSCSPGAPSADPPSPATGRLPCSRKSQMSSC